MPKQPVLAVPSDLRISRRGALSLGSLAVAAMAAEAGCNTTQGSGAPLIRPAALDIPPATDAPAIGEGTVPEDGSLTTADVLIERLIAWQVGFVFGIPGDGINPIIEALRKRQDRIRFIQVRHEEAAAFMATGLAKYTGNLGVCLATTGPGAVHLLNGLYDAKLEGTPVLALTGYTYHDMAGTHHPQDLDLVTLFKDVSLFDALVMGPSHALTIADIACRTALSARGVAHLTIPIDIQAQRLDEEKNSRQKGKSRAMSTFAPTFAEAPAKAQLDAAAKALNGGKKTAILVGRGALGASDEVLAVAKRLAAPVMKALLGKGVLPDDSPYTTRTTGHLGTLPSKRAIEGCDTLLIVGSTMPWLEFYPKNGQAKVVQIDRDPTRLGLRCSVDVGLVGDSKVALEQLLPLLDQRADQTFLLAAQDGMLRWDDALHQMEASEKTPMLPQVVMGKLSRLLADDALLSFDCGSHTVFGARHIRMRKGQQLCMAGNHTTMGPALPYVIAAQLAFPARQCVACVGDGGFTMLMADFLTAVKYNLPITVVVFKNNYLAHVIYEQIDEGYKEFGLDLQPLDFVKFAEACGGVGYRCEKPDEVETALRSALDSRRPAIVEAVVDPYAKPAAPDKYV